MNYLGSKVRFADAIVNCIWQGRYAHYVELCCGTAAVSRNLLERGAVNITVCDINQWGAFWNKVGKGELSINKLKRFWKYSWEAAKQAKHPRDRVYAFLRLQAESV